MGWTVTTHGEVSENDSDASMQVATIADILVGDVLVIGYMCEDVDATTVSGAGTNTLTKDGGVLPGSFARGGVFYCVVTQQINSGTNIVVNVVSAARPKHMHVRSWRPTGTAAFDDSSSNSGTGTAMTTGIATPAQDGDLAVCWFFVDDNVTFTGDADYTGNDEVGGDFGGGSSTPNSFTQYRTISGTADENAAVTRSAASADWLAKLLLFKETAGGGAATVSAVGGIASAEAFGVTRAQRVARNAGAISSAVALGAAGRVQRVARNAGAIASAESFGTAGRVQRVVRLVGGIDSAEAHGQPRIQFVVRPLGVSSAEAFGTVFIQDDKVVSGLGQIVSAESFGVVRVQRVIRLVGGISSAAALGEPRLTVVTSIRGLGAIASGEAFGEPRVVRIVKPVGLASAETFGSLSVRRYIGPQGITGAAALGEPRVVRRITTSGIQSAEAFGVARVVRIIGPTGIVSGLAFGTPFLGPVVIGDGSVYGQVALSDRARFNVVVSDTEFYRVTLSDERRHAAVVSDRPGG